MLYALQANMQIDAEIAAKGRFRTKTHSNVSQVAILNDRINKSQDHS